MIVFGVLVFVMTDIVESGVEYCVSFHTFFSIVLVRIVVLFFEIVSFHLDFVFDTLGM